MEPPGSYSPSSASLGSPEPQHLLHEHPLVSYKIWISDSKNPCENSTSYESYLANITEECNTKATANLFIMPTDSNCNCIVFQKSKRCFHVLSFVKDEDFNTAMQLRGEPLRSMLFYPTVDEEVILFVLNGITLIGQNEPKGCYIGAALPCSKCQVFIENIFNHKCSPEKLIATKAKSTISWSCKLPFQCPNQKIYLSTNAIMLGSTELHHLIPVVSRIYERLDALNIRTSIVQILAQDPLYQKTFDILESTHRIDEFFTYHLYLYLVHWLLPYLNTVKDLTSKVIPVFTVIRSEQDEFVKDVVGFDEDEEIDARLAACPDNCRSKVQEIFKDMDKNYTDEGKDVQNYVRQIIHDGFSTSFGTEWKYVLSCLDVKRPTYKGIRDAVSARIKQKLDGDTWSKHRDFIYEKQTEKIECSLTNIFNVIPRHRIAATPLKKAVLLSRGQYTYNIDLVRNLLEQRSVK